MEKQSDLEKETIKWLSQHLPLKCDTLFKEYPTTQQHMFSDESIARQTRRYSFDC